MASVRGVQAMTPIRNALLLRCVGLLRVRPSPCASRGPGLLSSALSRAGAFQPVEGTHLLADTAGHGQEARTAEAHLVNLAPF
jgi:hypothetical protein